MENKVYQSDMIQSTNSFKNICVSIVYKKG